KKQRPLPLHLLLLTLNELLLFLMIKLPLILFLLLLRALLQICLHFHLMAQSNWYQMLLAHISVHILHHSYEAMEGGFFLTSIILLYRTKFYCNSFSFASSVT